MYSKIELVGDNSQIEHPSVRECLRYMQLQDGIEIHHDRPIIYGCSDFLNDYEGIGGHERFNGELGLMYFPSFDPAGALDRLALVPKRIRHLRVNRARGGDVDWLAAMLTREGEPFGTRVEREPDDTLLIRRR